MTFPTVSGKSFKIHVVPVTTNRCIFSTVGTSPTDRISSYFQEAPGRQIPGKSAGICFVGFSWSPLKYYSIR